MAKKTPTIEVHQPALPLNTGPDREGLELHWYWRLRARNGDLAAAAACYALSAAGLSGYCFPWLRGRLGCPDLWPWERAAWKPKDARRDLVRAGALILAEIERLDRAQARHASDCAVHNAPAYPPGPCDCGAAT